MSTCNCKLCKERNTFKKILKKLSKEEQDFLEEIYDRMAMTEEDFVLIKEKYIALKKLNAL